MQVKDGEIFVGLTGIAGLEAEMRDRLGAANAEIERLRFELDKKAVDLHFERSENRRMSGYRDALVRIANFKNEDRTVADGEIIARNALGRDERDPLALLTARSQEKE
jgi:hypothetical protein